MTGPYVSLSMSVEHLPEGGKTGEVVLFDPAKQKLVELKEKAIPQEIISAKGFGASKGWLFFCDPQDRCVLMTDFMNPWACKSNPKLFTLPPLTPLPCCQTDLVWNVATSSCPDEEEEEDWVVGIKSLGDQLSFCRPRRDLRWTNISTPSDYFPTSNLMYSKKDKKFYLTGPGGHHLFSYDLQFNREFHELKFHNFTEAFKYDLEITEMLPSSTRTDYLVESPSGDERFLVKWYAKGGLDSSKKVSYETQRIMVFREEETLEGRFMCYTDDIGDLSIFISKAEAFCVPTSSFPGLKPNSIYFLGFGLGTYDLTTRTASTFHVPGGVLDLGRVWAPYWFPPSST